MFHNHFGAYSERYGFPAVSRKKDKDGSLCPQKDTLRPLSFGIHEKSLEGGWATRIFYFETSRRGFMPAGPAPRRGASLAYDSSV
jgi:hypothetical protein